MRTAHPTRAASSSAVFAGHRARQTLPNFELHNRAVPCTSVRSISLASASRCSYTERMETPPNTHVTKTTLQLSLLRCWNLLIARSLFPRRVNETYRRQPCPRFVWAAGGFPAQDIGISCDETCEVGGLFHSASPPCQTSQPMNMMLKAITEEMMSNVMRLPQQLNCSRISR